MTISGERFAALRREHEKLLEFALRLTISPRSATEYLKPGPHRIQIGMLEKMAAALGTDREGAFKLMGANGQRVVDNLSQEKADYVEALRQIKKAANGSAPKPPLSLLREFLKLDRDAQLEALRALGPALSSLESVVARAMPPKAENQPLREAAKKRRRDHDQFG